MCVFSALSAWRYTVALKLKKPPKATWERFTAWAGQFGLEGGKGLPWKHLTQGKCSCSKTFTQNYLARNKTN